MLPSPVRDRQRQPLLSPLSSSSVSCSPYPVPSPLPSNVSTPRSFLSTHHPHPVTDPSPFSSRFPPTLTPEHNTLAYMHIAHHKIAQFSISLFISFFPTALSKMKSSEGRLTVKKRTREKSNEVMLCAVHPSLFKRKTRIARKDVTLVHFFTPTFSFSPPEVIRLKKIKKIKNTKVDG